MDYQLYMNSAISASGSLTNGAIFSLKDLFSVEDWTRLSKGERGNFGKYFKNQVLEGLVPGVSFLEKKSSLIYRKR